MNLFNDTCDAVNEGRDKLVEEMEKGLNKHPKLLSSSLSVMFLLILGAGIIVCLIVIAPWLFGG